MTSASPRRAAILGGNRIPFARQFGPYANASNQDMFTAALEGLVARHGLGGERLGEVVGGAVIKHSRDFNLTREAVLGSSLAPETTAYDVQQACGTGLENAILVSNKIKLGQIESGIAGGVDTASDAPIMVTEKLRRKLLRINRAKSTVDMAKAALAIRPGDIGIETPANTEPRTGLSMGDHMAITAKKWGIT
ncbi:MAG: acetyl-CoA C-acyltransferase, partial [Knoellia sp.]